MAQETGGDPNSRDKPEIKVVDRRPFTSEGKRREEAPEPPSREESASPEGPSSGRPAEGGQDVRGPGFTMREDPSRPQDRADRDAAFINLSISIFESGCIHLGLNREGEDREGGGTPDLGAARGAIAMLEMLKRKTAGNLNDEEARILESLLADLQMAYVMKAPGASS